MGFLRVWLLRILSLRSRWIGVLVACAVWLLWVIVGIWALVLLVVLVAIGYSIGWAVEHGVTWRDVLEKIMSRHDFR
jgi:uncharacterized membrane protein